MASHCSYQETDVLIVDGYRTPVGNINGCFSSMAAHELGAVVIKKLLHVCDLDPKDLSEVIMGQVLVAGQGMNPARQAAVGAGIPFSVPAHSVSVVCGSGLRAVVSAYQAICTGDSTLTIAGGQESMSQACHCLHLRSGLKFGDTVMRDSMLSDGLTDAFSKCHMGVTAENVAKRWGVSRGEQDEFAALSQQKIARAREAGAFVVEIVPVSIKSRRETVAIASDEFPRPDTTAQTLSKLRPCFVTDESGTVTAGNASGLNDGAAAVLIASGREWQARAMKEPLARIASWAQAGVDPEIMGTGPIPAIRKALEKAGWDLNSVDLFEINEAFAAQSIVVIRELGIDPAKVNVHGGSIGIGHPIGASGARVLVTLLHAMKRLGKRRGVVALCVGGGMGIAMCVERISIA